MTTRPTQLLTAAILGLSALASHAKDNWPNMDYGRFLSASYQSTEGKGAIEGAKAGCATN